MVVYMGKVYVFEFRPLPLVYIGCYVMIDSYEISILGNTAGNFCRMLVLEYCEGIV
jgi:hypothetical protein